MQERLSFEYGLSCVSQITPAPDDATRFFGAAFEGLNIESRDTFEGVKQMGPVKYRIGVGNVSFADGHAQSLQTPKLFATVQTTGGQLGNKYQFSDE